MDVQRRKGRRKALRQKYFCRILLEVNMKYNKLIVIFVLSFFVWQGNSFAQHSKKAERAFQEAKEAFYQRDYMSALKQLDKAISVESDFADAWIMKDRRAHV